MLREVLFIKHAPRGPVQTVIEHNTKMVVEMLFKIFKNVKNIMSESRLGMYLYFQYPTLVTTNLSNSKNSYVQYKQSVK